MPIYEYLCKTCNEVIMEPKAAEDRDNVPLCKTCGEKTKRLFSSPGVAFKGNGFYTTDK